jgi:hypothetical protein
MTSRREQAESIWEQGAGENIRTEERLNGLRSEKTV